MWRGGRAVEGARLESVWWSKGYSRVRIPTSPFFALWAKNGERRRTSLLFDVKEGAEMKSHHIVVMVLSIFVICIFFFSRTGQGLFGKLWNAYLMNELNCQLVQDEFVDKTFQIKFKLPTDVYASGVYDSWRYRHVDLSWYLGAKVHSLYLLKIGYEKVHGEPREEIKKAIEEEVSRVSSSKSFSNVQIEINELIDSPYGPKGRLRYSLNLGERRTDETCYFVRHGFLIDIRYINSKKAFDRLDGGLLNDMFDGIPSTVQLF